MDAIKLKTSKSDIQHFVAYSISCIALRPWICSPGTFAAVSGSAYGSESGVKSVFCLQRTALDIY